MRCVRPDGSRTAPDLHFRVAQDGREYCLEHLPPRGEVYRAPEPPLSPLTHRICAETGDKARCFLRAGLLGDDVVKAVHATVSDVKRAQQDGRPRVTANPVLKATVAQKIEAGEKGEKIAVR